MLAASPVTLESPRLRLEPLTTEHTADLEACARDGELWNVRVTSVPALWTKHRPIARGIASDFYLPGSDRDDVRQEADIALWEAATHYRREHGSFPAFARLVVKRRLVDRLKESTREKRRVLTDATREIEDAMTGDPLEDRERLRALVKAMHTLNEWERDAVVRIVNDVPIQGKTDDTQRYRVRKKLREAA